MRRRKEDNNRRITPQEPRPLTRARRRSAPWSTRLCVVVALSATTRAAAECAASATPERAATEPRLPTMFVDLGANYGSSIDRAVEKGIIADAKATEVYAFEPNPKFEEPLTELLELHGFGFWKLVPNPAYVRSEETVFYVDDRPTVYSKHAGKSLKYDAPGSSLFDRSHAETRPVEAHALRVCTIRFADWLDANVPEGQRVVVKMDIEGAEFDVLEDLLHSQTIGKIDTLYIEWHGIKIRPDLCCKRASGTGPTRCGPTCPLEKALMTAIAERGVHVYIWDE